MKNQEINQVVLRKCLFYAMTLALLTTLNSCIGDKNIASHETGVLTSKNSGKLDELGLLNAINGSGGKEKFYLMCKLEDIKATRRISSEDETLIAEILASAREIFGPSSLEFADALMRQARRLGLKHEFARSAKAYEEARRIFAKEGASYNLKQMECLSGRISGECAEGKCEQEVQLYTDLLRLRRDAYGDKDARTIIAMTMLGEIQMRRHEYATALKLFTEAYQNEGKGTAIYRTGILLNLARTHIYLDHFAEAESFLRPVLQSSEANYKTEQVSFSNLVSTLKVYALLYDREKKYKEEVAVAKRILDLEEARMGRNDPSLNKALFLYASSLEKSGQTKEAQAVRKRLDSLEFNRAAEKNSKAK